MKTSVTAASAGSGRVSVHGRAWVPRHPAVTLGVVVVLDAGHPWVHDLGRWADRMTLGVVLLRLGDRLADLPGEGLALGVVLGLLGVGAFVFHQAPPVIGQGGESERACLSPGRHIMAFLGFGAGPSRARLARGASPRR